MTSLDRLDGGFSFIIRVPGRVPLKRIAADLKVDCYIPPRELTDSVMQRHVRLMIRYFIDNIALRHLQELDERFQFSNIDLGLSRVDDLAGKEVAQFPSPTEPGSSWYQYTCDVRGELVRKPGINNFSMLTLLYPEK
jgi:hypothetical protein